MATKDWTEPLRGMERDLRESSRQLWLATLGTFATLEETAGEVYDGLIERGRKLETSGRRQLKRTRSELESATGELGDRIDHGITETLQRLGVPSRRQVQDLITRVERLSARLDEISGKSP